YQVDAGFARSLGLFHHLQAELALQAGEGPFQAPAFFLAAWGLAKSQGPILGLGIAPQLFQYANLSPAGFAMRALLIKQQGLLQLTAPLQLLGDLKQQARLAAAKVWVA
ncbi:hypothetical protein, partial [Stutzerimonas frequens]|uniref:hypothetical protein n=1 Tax=Stutzerimonas frequens TaxID=2968969 RepID=UPI000AC6501D